MGNYYFKIFEIAGYFYDVFRIIVFGRGSVAAVDAGMDD